MPPAAITSAAVMSVSKQWEYMARRACCTTPTSDEVSWQKEVVSPSPRTTAVNGRHSRMNFLMSHPVRKMAGNRSLTGLKNQAKPRTSVY
jgi:hypothetical protein